MSKFCLQNAILILSTCSLCACSNFNIEKNANDKIKIVDVQTNKANVTTPVKPQIKVNQKQSAIAKQNLQIQPQTENTDTSTPSISEKISNDLDSTEVNSLLTINPELNTNQKEQSIELIPTDTDNETRPQGVAENLPSYASYSQMSGQNCDITLGTSATTAAADITTNLVKRYNGPHEYIYVAPTLIPDEYIDCISDLSGTINNAIKNINRFRAVENDKLNISYQAYSPTFIPSLIRECRKANIPYLVISQIKNMGNKPALNIRFIRVNDGITIFQNYKRLK